ncbi:protein of unknown function (DUF1824) [Fragilaria crotonensis]|nr:protein of unknown function (DUF1824) [Fragilaria crotonensis]
MWHIFLFVSVVALTTTHAFVISLQFRNNRNSLTRSSTPTLTSCQLAAVYSIEDATKLLAEWDRSTNPDRVKSTASNDSTIDNSADDGVITRDELKQAVLLLNNAAREERDADSTKGQCLLGICASSAQEGVAALKSWVTTLGLPRGLLHGMDKDGVPLELNGGVYIKYNSGGVFTFADIRKSGLGFDSLWKPGDAMLEEYDGVYRGVYFQVQLQDGEFRQYLVPMNLLDDNL